MNKWTELLIGLLLVIGSILVWSFTGGTGFWDFGTAAWEFLKGGLLWAVLLIGVVLIILGISDIKEK